MKPLEPDLGWNRRKLLIFIVLVIAILGAGLIVLGKESSGIKGANVYSPPPNDSFNKVSSDFSQGIRDKVTSIQQDARSLDVSEIATSSPQIQKVIKDIQSIQDLPSSQAKKACQRICDGL